MGSTRKNAGVRREFWLIGILLVVAVVLGAILLTGRNEEGGSAAPPRNDVAEMGPAGDLSRRIDGDPVALGSVAAPVVLVAYSDYRCPFCAKFSRDTEPVLIEKYVDAGVLRMEWRDMPIFGEQSNAAARAGRAAADQGKFWEFNSAAYAQAPDRGHPDLPPEVLRGFAEKAGVADLDMFDRDAASTKYDESIVADIREAQAIGVSSTPSFIINGHPILGAQPLAVFEKAIDQAAGR